MKIETNKFHEIDYFVAGISGGKDSTALLLYLVKEFLPQNNIPLDNLICTFADTENEAPETYEHIQLISEKIHPVIWLKYDLGFYELAKSKKMFPHKKARFCTQLLKLEPAKRYMNTLEGNILSLSGVRADESLSRSKYTEFAGANETYHGYTEWRPLLKWKIEDVFLIHKKYDFPLNPLYSIGFSRVGCFPCIVYANKKEIRLLATKFPERIDLLREKENSFSDDNGGTRFNQAFPLKKTPERYRSKEVSTKKGIVKVATIDDVVEWSKTSDRKRGSQFDFHFEDYSSPFEESSCMAGVCE